MVCFSRDLEIIGFERRTPVLRLVPPEMKAGSAANWRHKESKIFMLSSRSGGHVPYIIHLQFFSPGVMVCGSGEYYHLSPMLSKCVKPAGRIGLARC